MRELVISIFLISLISNTFCEELCGLEPPKEGESCGGASGDENGAEEEKYFPEIVWNQEPTPIEEEESNFTTRYEYVEKPLTPEEQDVWDRRFYTKIRYTNHYDWPIRKLLDNAEEHIAQNYDKAIEAFSDILKDYPDSPRAKYLLIRVQEMKLDNSTDHQTFSKTEAYKKELAQILDKYEALMEKYVDPEDEDKEDQNEIMPVMFYSLFSHTLMNCEELNDLKRVSRIYQTGIEKCKNYKKEFRHHYNMIQANFALNDMELAKKSIDNAKEQFPDHLVLQFFEGLYLKFIGQKKEANKLLRSIDSSKDLTEITHDMNRFGRMLHNQGLENYARILYQEGSKLHIFLNQYQRPVVIKEQDFETNMIWTMDNVGLTSYDEELTELTNFYPTLKEEVLKVAENVTETVWNHLQVENTCAGNHIKAGSQGKYWSLPFFYYGKRRRLHCKDLLPKTCKFIKETIPRAANMKYGIVKLNVLDSKTKTMPLEALTNAKLRIIMPVQIPEEFQIVLGKDTSVSLKEGQWTVIDDSFERVFDNEKGEKAAIWVSLDIPHPDLSAEDEKGISITEYAKKLFLYF